MNKVGRNDLCPCGSGKKHKYCCLEKEEYSKDTLDGLLNLQMAMLEKKEHIKKYRKCRKIHSEILNDMMIYHQEGKFAFQYMNKNFEVAGSIRHQDIAFDLSENVGKQSMVNLLVYKNTADCECLCERFLNEKKYRDEEKINFLQGMLHSEGAPVEVVSADRNEGYVVLRDILCGKEFKIIDIALSSLEQMSNVYCYVRIITSLDISFASGLSIPFKKEDNRIQEWIAEHKTKYKEEDEFQRFISLYQLYIQNPEVGLHTNLVK